MEQNTINKLTFVNQGIYSKLGSKFRNQFQDVFSDMDNDVKFKNPDI